MSQDTSKTTLTNQDSAVLQPNEPAPTPVPQKFDKFPLEGVYDNAGGGAAAGSNKQIQFNVNGMFGASTKFTFDEATMTLRIGNGSADDITIDASDEATLSFLLAATTYLLLHPDYLEFEAGGGDAVQIDTSLLTNTRSQQISDSDGRIPVVEGSGSGAPGFTPQSIGDIYVDTTNAKIYVSAGTSASTDWKLLN
jgi:hypothetical protein